MGTKLPEIFDLRYEYLFRRQFTRVSEANEIKVKIVLRNRNKYEWSEEKISVMVVPTSLYSA
jgi:hypothetical protein